MLIKKGGVYRETTKKKFEKDFKKLGYKIVEKNKPLDLSEYHKGGGWYEYKGESYRKKELKELLGD